MMEQDAELQRLMARYPQPAQAMPGQAMPPQQPMPGMAPAMAQQQGAGLSPELVQQVLAMQSQGQQQSGIKRQRMLADQLRADAGGQLQGRQTGQIYTPPNLANLAANIYGGYKAKQMTDDADTREQNMSVQAQDAMRKYFASLTGNKTQPQLSYMGAEGE